MTTNWSTNELEGLRVSEAIGRGILAERDELRAEINRLIDAASHAAQRIYELETGNERLRAAIEAYLENDSQANWDALAALVSDKPLSQRAISRYE